MQRSLIIQVLALLCLLSVAGALSAQQARDADKKEEALKKLEVLMKQLDDLEAGLAEERIAARQSQMEKEEAVRSLDRRRHLDMQALATERSKLEELIREIDNRVANPDDAKKIKDQAAKKLAELTLTQEKLSIQGADARMALVIAEEKFRLLERKHDNQRRLMNLKIDLVEQELFGKTEATDRRRQEKLEKALDTIQRDLEELRRKTEGKDATKP